MSHTIKDIALLLKCRTVPESDQVIAYLLTDSRKVVFPGASLFFALKGGRRDGHTYIKDLYERGVRAFVVTSTSGQSEEMADAVFLEVPDTLQALQTLAAEHRRSFGIPVIGITGSNGKTIVKEWLYQLLHDTYRIARSPKSYNSQIGVPLSVWGMHSDHTLAIFEAGISQSGEMDKLKKIIQPTIGVFTNIGEAHSEGFLNTRQKVNEKLRLFTDVECLVYRKDDTQVHEAVAGLWQQMNRSDKQLELVNWSTLSEAAMQVLTLFKEDGKTQISSTWKGKLVQVTIPFTDDASIENAIHCWCVLLHLGVAPALIAKKMEKLQPVAMRLELKQAIHQSTLINDSYNNDVNALMIALDFLSQQAKNAGRTVILSDILESGKPESELYAQVAALLAQHGIRRLFAVGERIFHHRKLFTALSGLEAYFYPVTASLLDDLSRHEFRNETILLKGARPFAFEEVQQRLELQRHQTVLEINLTALAHNLKKYQERLRQGTRIMAMVKAFAYGSGSFEIAHVLQFHKVDYLAVAYTDEGVALREAGIRLPIMVMNPEPAAWEKLSRHMLEPVLYSLQNAQDFARFLEREALVNYPVHIEVETGMNRLGFSREDLPHLGKLLHQDGFRIQSVFSHLAASEDPSLDDYTKQQAELFSDCCSVIENFISYPFLRHLANTSAIARHPEVQLDMVRIGIGLYGIDPLAGGLLPVSTLKTTIAQVKHIKKGETVGYNRKGKVKKDSLIATLRIGYADGYPRTLGEGKGHVLINGRQAPTIGAVCMDMTMVDVSDIPGVAEGQEAILFGKELSVASLAEKAGTISYDLLAGISQRVNRVYIEE